MDRRDFLKTAGAAALASAVFTPAFAKGKSMEQKEPGKGVSNVYFTKDLSAAGLIKLYKKINEGITGRVAIKLHTGVFIYTEVLTNDNGGPPHSLLNPAHVR